MRKVEKWAAPRGLSVTHWEVEPGLMLQTGEVAADPSLGRRLAEAALGGWLRPWTTADLLRYNPLRRAVLRQGGRVVRVEAKAHPLRADFQRFVASVVSTPRRHDDGSNPHLSVMAFTGDGDLGHCQLLSASRAAGAELAALHAATSKLPEQLAAKLSGRGSDALTQAEAHARLLDVLAPELAPRVRAVGQQLAAAGLEGHPVLSHGDMSPDQVLVRLSDGHVWLTDFDRACLDVPASDLGSYLAVAERDCGRSFIEGYEEAGGAVPSSDQLRLGIARSLLLRLAEPMRAGMPEWRVRMATQLERVEALI
ncbi:MAG: aminoglycoside phosphotransferase family protein [Propionibacteriaceae bacterium]|nr:aminoglycoside phosphotransferase family protein [Propionibacteriaceae bacterium]